jgi:hypothetical protein
VLLRHSLFVGRNPNAIPRLPQVDPEATLHVTFRSDSRVLRRQQARVWIVHLVPRQLIAFILKKIFFHDHVYPAMRFCTDAFGALVRLRWWRRRR